VGERLKKTLLYEMTSQKIANCDVINIAAHLVFNHNVLFESFTVFKVRTSGSQILRSYLFTVSYIAPVQNMQLYKRTLYLGSNKITSNITSNNTTKHFRTVGFS